MIGMEIMKTYRTGEVAAIVGVHPNTVRLYEKIGFISVAKRHENGYRIFTDIHIKQMKLARLAMKAEILQNGLRKKAVSIVRLCAEGETEKSLNEAYEYENMINHEIQRAESAVSYAEKIINNTYTPDKILLTRKQAADTAGITIDSLRNWELNGLIKVRRKSNGYRVYNSCDMEKISIIRTLRCADYSLSAILRLMNVLEKTHEVKMKEILNSPSEDEDIISVCDRLLVSLYKTRNDAKVMQSQLSELIKYKTIH